MKATIRFWVRIIVLLALVLAGLVLMRKAGWLKFPDFFTAKPIQIAETPVLLQEIKAIGEWQTATMYAEVVADTLRYTQMDAVQDAVQRIFLPGSQPQHGDRLVLIVRGKVIAGFDWQKLVAGSLQVVGDSVAIQLPPVQWLDVVANPGDVTVFVEEGSWPGNAVAHLTQQGRRKLIAEAEKQQLAQRATAQAQQALTTLLLRAGFKKVTFVG